MWWFRWRHMSRLLGTLGSLSIMAVLVICFQNFAYYAEPDPLPPVFVYNGFYGAISPPQIYDDYMDTVSNMANFVMIEYVPDELNVSGTRDPIAAANKARARGMKVILSIQGCLFKPPENDPEYKYTPQPDSIWINCFNDVVAPVAEIGNVLALYIADEAYGNGLTKAQLEQAANIVRANLNAHPSPRVQALKLMSSEDARCLDYTGSTVSISPDPGGGCTFDFDGPGGNPPVTRTKYPPPDGVLPARRGIDIVTLTCYDMAAADGGIGPRMQVCKDYYSALKQVLDNRQQGQRVLFTGDAIRGPEAPPIAITTYQAQLDFAISKSFIGAWWFKFPKPALNCGTHCHWGLENYPSMWQGFEQMIMTHVFPRDSFTRLVMGKNGAIYDNANKAKIANQFRKYPTQHEIALNGSNIMDGRGDLMIRVGKNSLDSGKIKVLVSNGTALVDSNTDWTSGFHSHTFNVYAGDVNGDGFSDLISWNIITGNIEIFKNTGQNSFAYSLGAGANGAWQNTFAPETRYELFFADMDGDGKVDLMARDRNEQNLLVFHNGHPDRFYANFNNKFHYYLTVPSISNSTEIYFADVNGDGREELITRQPGPEGKIFVRLAEFIRDSSNSTWRYSYGPASVWKEGFANYRYRLYFHDVTGDGRADLISQVFDQPLTGFGVGDIHVLAAAANSFEWTNGTNRWTHGWTDSYELYFADVTGDGKVDLLGRLKSSGQIMAALSQGSSFTYSGTWATTSMNDSIH